MTARKIPKLADPDVAALAAVARRFTAGSTGVVVLAVDEAGEGVAKRAMLADLGTAWDTASDLARDTERPAIVRVEVNGWVAVHTEDPRRVNGAVFHIDARPGAEPSVPADTPDDDELDEEL